MAGELDVLKEKMCALFPVQRLGWMSAGRSRKAGKVGVLLFWQAMKNERDMRYSENEKVNADSNGSIVSL